MSETFLATDLSRWSKVEALIKDAKFTMLSTVQPDGTIRSRPMAMPANGCSHAGELWFFTCKDATKCAEIRSNPHVNLSYVSGKSSFVSISGTAQMLEDKAKAAELWNPLYKAWFPQGLEDPTIALLRIQAKQAEYWDSTSPGLTQVMGFVKAAVTGEASKGEFGEHEKLTFDLDSRV